MHTRRIIFCKRKINDKMLQINHFYCFFLLYFYYNIYNFFPSFRFPAFSLHIVEQHAYFISVLRCKSIVIGCMHAAFIRLCAFLLYITITMDTTKKIRKKTVAREKSSSISLLFSCSFSISLHLFVQFLLLLRFINKMCWLLYIAALHFSMCTWVCRTRKRMKKKWGKGRCLSHIFEDCFACFAAIQQNYVHLNN